MLDTNAFRRVATRSDSKGNWTLGFIPPQHPGFHIEARHPRFANTSLVSSPKQETAEDINDPKLKLLWSGNLVSTMNEGFELTGAIIDEYGFPIPSARIYQHGRTQAISDGIGQFQVPMLKQGNWAFTVVADGFAPLRTNIIVDISSEPMVITLQTGAVLKLRIREPGGPWRSAASLKTNYLFPTQRSVQFL